MARIIVALPFMALLSFSQSNNRGWYRSPALYGDTIAFSSEGDLWLVGVEGGLARRLTTLGNESSAVFSPDGASLAFSAGYEGTSEIYTMPTTGGLPVRRTYEGGGGQGGAQPVGWTPDGKIIYSTHYFSGLPDAQLATIDDHNRIERIPLSQAAQGCYNIRGDTLFFTRLERQPSFTKRYHGGRAENLWKYEPGKEAVPLTADYPGASRNPMCWKDRVYFLSDRDGTMNLWSIDESGKQLKQHTEHQGFDIKSASLSQGKIVYQLTADLRIYDIATGRDRAVPIELPSDFQNLREHWIKNPVEYLTAAHFSSAGDKVVLTARGHVFVTPTKDGRFVDVSEHKPGRFREGRLMPDGKSVVALSTESGEVELWLYPSNGKGPGKQLTHDGNVLRWEAIPSPDGKWIVHQDKEQRLWLYNLMDQSNKKLFTSHNRDNDNPAFADLRWSPDSHWLTFAESADNGFEQVMLYSLDTGVKTPLTTDRYNSGAATWSADGRWVYFISDRALKSTVRGPFGSRMPDPYFDRSKKIYELPLRSGLISPFQPPDELTLPKSESPNSSDKAHEKPPAEQAEEPKVDKVEIELGGINARLREVPVPPANYQALQVAGGKLCWINEDPTDPQKNTLECVAIANKGDKPETLLDGVKTFEVSGDGKKIMVQRQNDLLALDSVVSAEALKNPKALSEVQVDLKRWNFSIIPAQEFGEAYLDAWRLERDYFYDPGMHHVDWSTIRDKYSGLVGRVRDRYELSDLISDMVSELSALHTFVGGGDLRKAPDQIPVGALGALLTRDDDAGGYRVDHIYQTDPDRPDQLSPLLRSAGGFADGDVITTINGRSVLSAVHPNELLRDQIGKQVLLTYHHKGNDESHDAIVKPISMSQDADLRYSEWEYTRRKEVDLASNGQIGYIHLRAMGLDDIGQWEEQYTPIYDRQALIVDVRHNQGGNIDSWLLGKLLRKAWMYWQARQGPPFWNMQGAFRGPMIVLCDEITASDGEAFSEGFRRLGLGKILGMRTWGGEIWLSGSNKLADQGVATAAEVGVYGPERKWLIEGHGVDPDIVVDNLPHATFEGRDAQLETAIRVLLDDIKEHPEPVPAPPVYPNKALFASKPPY